MRDCHEAHRRKSRGADYASLVTAKCLTWSQHVRVIVAWRSWCKSDHWSPALSSEASTVMGNHPGYHAVRCVLLMYHEEKLRSQAEWASIVVTSINTHCYKQQGMGDTGKHREKCAKKMRERQGDHQRLRERGRRGMGGGGGAALNHEN